LMDRRKRHQPFISSIYSAEGEDDNESRRP
jgi:hypothetical protein